MPLLPPPKSVEAATPLVCGLMILATGVLGYLICRRIEDCQTET